MSRIVRKRNEEVVAPNPGLPTGDKTTLNKEAPRVDGTAPDPQPAKVDDTTVEKDAAPGAQPPTSTSKSDIGPVESKRREEFTSSQAAGLDVVKNSSLSDEDKADLANVIADLANSNPSVSLDEIKFEIEGLSVDPKEVQAAIMWLSKRGESRKVSGETRLRRNFEILMTKSEQLLQAFKNEKAKSSKMGSVISKKESVIAALKSNNEALSKKLKVTESAYSNLRLSVETKLDLTKIAKMKSEGMTDTAIREFVRRTPTPSAQKVESFKSRATPTEKPLFKDESRLDGLLKGMKISG